MERPIGFDPQSPETHFFFRGFGKMRGSSANIFIIISRRE
uniref:Uncharacterized protein n=1 Tax=Picea sitchensis TaxID=3332 RepID=A9NLR9_PICSI|nr:unknown [Picea sitchensis]